jgi:hypothetical protein
MKIDKTNGIFWIIFAALLFVLLPTFVQGVTVGAIALYILFKSDNSTPKAS